MSAIIFLFALGVIFLGFELFVPGIVMGVVGFFSMVAGCAYAFNHYGMLVGLSACGAALLLIVLTALLEFFWLPRTRLGQRLFLTKAIVATSQPLPADAELMIGKEAEAQTILAPSGYVVVEGRAYEASSQDGHIAKGTRLLVRAVDRTTLKVSKLPSNS